MHTQLIGLSVGAILVILCLAKRLSGRGALDAMSVVQLALALLTIPAAISVVCAFYFVSPPDPNLISEDTLGMIGIVVAIVCSFYCVHEIQNFFQPAASAQEPVKEKVSIASVKRKVVHK